jgi:hypothetical protein
MDIRTISAVGYDLWEEITTVSGMGSGSVELEYDWQLIGIPVEFGYWNPVTHEHVHDVITIARFENYILDQVTDLYGNGIIEVANAYIGDNQFFWSYVVGSTPTSSPHNFPMIFNDGIHKEVVGFWVRVVGGASPYVITWGE